MTMKASVTYLHHSGFLLELERAYFLFDWWQEELPAMDVKKPLYVLVSHSHRDHFSPRIFDLADRFEDVIFILSDDIDRAQVPGEILHHSHNCFSEINENPEAQGCGNQNSGTQSCGIQNGGTQIRTFFLKPHESWQIGELLVQTLLSNDLGIGFWCEAEGVTFYHAGDLNNWDWDDDEEDAANAEQYHKELERITKINGGVIVDIAFVPVDPRLRQNYWMGLADFLKYCQAKWVFPMHFGDDFSVKKSIRGELERRGQAKRPAGNETPNKTNSSWPQIVEISKRGEQHEISF